MKLFLTVGLLLIAGLTGTLAAPPLPAGTYSGFEIGPVTGGFRTGSPISMTVSEDRKVTFTYYTVDPITGIYRTHTVGGRFIGSGLVRGYRGEFTFRAGRQGTENSFRGFRRIGTRKYLFYADLTEAAHIE